MVKPFSCFGLALDKLAPRSERIGVSSLAADPRPLRVDRGARVNAQPGLKPELGFRSNPPQPSLLQSKETDAAGHFPLLINHGSSRGMDAV